MKNPDTGLIVRGIAGVALMLAAGIVPAAAQSLPLADNAVYNSSISSPSGGSTHGTSPGTITNANGYVTLGAFPSPYIDAQLIMPRNGAIGGGGSFNLRL